MLYVMFQHVVQGPMTPASYAAQFAQNGEATVPLKAAEAGKETPVAPGPPFSPPPASLPLNGLDQQTVSLVSTQFHIICGFFCNAVKVRLLNTLGLKWATVQGMICK